LAVLSNQQIKEGDTVLDMSNRVWKNMELCFVKAAISQGGAYKIIAYQPKMINKELEKYAPELNLPLLPEITIENDVEKLAEQYVNSISYKAMKEDFAQGYLMAAFINGYKTATKVYTEEDLREAIQYAYNKGVLELDINIDEIISQSLKKPKWFFAETESIFYPANMPKEGEERPPYRLKTTTINGKTSLVGNYLYE
jgi:hypothetical protein